jgi:hypothetical protein
MLVNGSTATEGLSGSASAGSHRVASTPAWPNAIYPQRASYVLDPLLAGVLEGEIELVAYLVAHHPIYTDPARLRQGFEPCRDVHTVTVDVTAILNDVAEIDPDTKLNALLFRHSGVAFSHLELNLDGAPHRVDNACELDEQPVAGRLDDAPAMLFDFRVSKLASQLLQRG